MDLVSRFISLREDLDGLPLDFLRRAALEEAFFRLLLEDERRRFSFAMTPPIESFSSIHCGESPMLHIKHLIAPDALPRTD